MAVLLAASSFTGGQALAQDGAGRSGPGPAPAAGEIIVTAQKREEKLINVPIALTAFAGTKLEAVGAQNLGDFIQEAPGLAFYDLGTGQTKIAIRGISTNLGGNENGYYLDELPFTSVSTAQSPDVRAWDLDRIEVLRGPQGTLFGEGSLGGTVRIITADPDLNSFLAKGNAQLSTTEDGGTNYGLKAALNLPIIEDRLAVRIAGTHERQNGWIDDPIDGRSNVNDQNIDTLRVKLKARPTDWLTLGGTYWYYNGRFPSGSQATDSGDLPASQRVSARLRYEVYNGVANADLGFADLLYSYGHNEQTAPTEGPLLGGTVNITDITKIDSHELRMSSRGSGPLKWTVGLYQRTAVRDSNLVLAILGLDNFSSVSTKARAAFGELTYTLPFAPIDLTAGLRYFTDRLRGYDVSSGVTTTQPGGDYKSWNPRFNIAWHPSDDLNIYATAAKGFRSGQLQPANAQQIAPLFGISLPAALASDSLWSYELGFKANLANRIIFLQGAIYRMDWKDVAVSLPIATTGLNGLINSNGTTSTGVEMSATARATPELNLTVGGSYIDASYDAAVAGTGIVAGSDVEGISKFSFNASAQYRRAVGRDTFLNVHLGYQHFSPRKNTAFAIYRPSDTIDTVTARIGVEIDRVSLTLFADNLTNERGATTFRTVLPVTATTVEAFAPRLRPRTIGIEGSFRF